MDLQHDGFSAPEKVGDVSRIASSRCQLRSCWEVPESTGSTRENCLSTGMLVGLVGPEDARPRVVSETRCDQLPMDG